MLTPGIVTLTNLIKTEIKIIFHEIRFADIRYDEMFIERFFHDRTNKLRNASFIIKFNFHLGRMHIYIYLGGFDIQINSVKRILILLCPGIVKAQNHIAEISVLKRTAINK